MCGIAGFSVPLGLALDERRTRFAHRIGRMTASLRHRGPDAQRAVLLDGAALGHTRLSIVDVANGHQPMIDPATGVALVFNGEVFNHVELRERLKAGYAFRTRSDTEVILAAYLAKGLECVQDFIGQFAFALWDPRTRALHLARDRVGVRPLFYAVTDEGLGFASEVKALFAAEWVKPALDARAIKQTIQLWAPVAPRTTFEDVFTVEPGCVATWDGTTLSRHRYWDLDLSDDAIDDAMDEERAVARLGETLEDAVRLRLRADVPVAAYLSGGLDSSVICALAQRQLGGTLSTFSVSFADGRYDEGAFQQEVARSLRTRHHAVRVTDAEIGALLPEVVEHAEQVLLRSAPAPFLRLSRLVREQDTKVVLTGEGSDEVFLGYDLFKETKVREFWARRPDSTMRPALFRRLYPYLPLSQHKPEMLRQFFGLGLEDTTAFGFSHVIRWNNSGRIARFFAKSFEERVAGVNPSFDLQAALPARVATFSPLGRAQYLELHTLLSGYLLSAQGDRMLMGNSIEGRFPFLDHRVIELGARIPRHLRLRSLREKHILKRYAERLVPQAVTERHKFPYRAPIAETLVGPNAPAWVRTLLSAEAVSHVGVFDGEKIGRLVQRLSQSATPPSEADNMALMAVASTQLLFDRLLQPRSVPTSRVDEVSLFAA